MILPFKEFFPWHTKDNPAPTYFREKILAGVLKKDERTSMYFSGIAGFSHILKHKPKIHTIRASNRWKAGDKIHMAYGMRTKNYQQFNKGIPELEAVKGVQNISIKYLLDDLFDDILPNVAIDGKILKRSEVDMLAQNDGFEGIDDFFNWFTKDFQGLIIHWTDFRY